MGHWSKSRNLKSREQKCWQTQMLKRAAREVKLGVGDAGDFFMARNFVRVGFTRIYSDFGRIGVEFCRKLGTDTKGTD